MQNLDLKLSFEPHSIQNFDSVISLGLFEAVVIGSIIVLISLDKEVTVEFPTFATPLL